MFDGSFGLLGRENHQKPSSTCWNHVSDKRVRKILRASLNLTFSKQQHTPKLKKYCNANHLAWAIERVSWGFKWQQVFFFDEKKHVKTGPKSSIITVMIFVKSLKSTRPGKCEVARSWSRGIFGSRVFRNYSSRRSPKQRVLLTNTFPTPASV